jgi:class 3 adenylate cyclase
MDWEAEGLLEGLEDDAAKTARARLLDELHEQGMSVEELRRVVAEDKLVLAPVAQALSSESRYTAREIAEKAGVDLAFLAASRRALGLPVPGDDERVYGEKDLEAAQLGIAHREVGFDDDDALEVARVLGQGMARYAEATRALVARTFLEPGLDEYELAHRYQAVAEQLMPLAGPWLEHVFALHLQQVLRSDALTQEQRRSGKLDDTQDAVVAFADLVGFTELGESLPVEELGSVAGRLSALTGEALEPEVKLQGDRRRRRRRLRVLRRGPQEAQGLLDAGPRVSSAARRRRLTSSVLAKIASASLSTAGSCVVATASTRIPAARAEAMPAGASSITRQTLGSTPSLDAAVRYGSGCGLPWVMSLAVTSTGGIGIPTARIRPVASS